MSRLAPAVTVRLGLGHHGRFLWLASAVVDIAADITPHRASFIDSLWNKKKAG